MAIREILQLGNPVLRQVSEPAGVASEVVDVLRDLEDTLLEFRRTHGFGRGISAIQIGVAKRVIFLEVEGLRYELINPCIVNASEEMFELWDDCFSFPGLMVKLKRHREIVLKYQGLDGQVREMTARDSFGELIQHEMDHLDGVLAVDRAQDCLSLATRAEYLRQST